MKYRTFEEMPVWQKAMDLATKVFGLTEALPAKEDDGLTSQIRRSALSVSGNIAEGFGRNHSKDKMRFYYNSRGSLTETKSHLIYGQRVGYFKQLYFEDLSGVIQEVWRELNSLIKRIPRCSASGFLYFPSPSTGEGEGGGEWKNYTLPFIPSPQGRGDLGYLAALLRGSSFSALRRES